MNDSQRYRAMAAKCLQASYNARSTKYRTIQLSMAMTGLSLARHDEDMDRLLRDWDFHGVVAVVDLGQVGDGHAGISRR